MEAENGNFVLRSAAKVDTFRPERINSIFMLHLGSKSKECFISQVHCYPWLRSGDNENQIWNILYLLSWYIYLFSRWWRRNTASSFCTVAKSWYFLLEGDKLYLFYRIMWGYKAPEGKKIFILQNYLTSACRNKSLIELTKLEIL